MPDVIARLVSSGSEYQSSVLELFLQGRESKFSRDYGLVEGAIEFETFRAEVLHFTEWAEHLMQSATTSGSTLGASQLVLGKVQSGKTSHFTALLAWAIDRGVTAAVVATGVNDALWGQSRKRLEKDIGQLRRPSPALFFQTPTTGELKGSGASVLHDFVAAARRRAEDGPLAPMPILVTMKNGQRLAPTRIILQRALSSIEDARYLLIDDEADQASPNITPSSRRRPTSGPSTVHGRMADLRNGIAPHLLLSYTATPQAILLADPDNALAPDFVHVVPTGRGYFGLKNLLSERRSGVHIVDDAHNFEHGERPATLDEALIRFLVAGAVRRRWPEIFFSRAVPGADLEGRPNYVSFLIHPSGKQSPHLAAARMVSDFRDEFVRAAQENLNGVVDGVLRPAYKQWLTGLPESLRSLLPASDGPDTTALLESVLLELRHGRFQGRVVNSSTGPSSFPYGLPEHDDEWEVASYWVLIGGDILGRGITLNNLVGTYFLRNPKSPNMDTAVQQMRFCGYRRDYSDMIDVWVPRAVHDLYVDIDEIDSVAWTRAEKLSRLKRPIRGGLPVAYVAASGHRMSPTRKGAISKDIVDYDYGETVFQTRQIGGPRRTAKNVRFLWKFLSDLGVFSWVVDNEQWTGGDVDASVTYALLRGLTCGSHDSTRRDQVVDLFDRELGGSFSLSERVTVLHVRQPSLLSQRPDTWVLEASGPNSPLASRAAADATTLPESAGQWREAVARFWDQALEPEVPFERVSIGAFIGGEHRRLQDEHPGSVGLFVEPLGIGRSGRSGDRAGRRAGGVAVGVLAPEGFSVRLVGHRKSVRAALAER